MQTATQTSRSTRLEARISPVQKALFQQAAALTGRTLSDLVVESTQDAATKIIQDHTIIRLSQEDQAAFVQALLNPPRIICNFFIIILSQIKLKINI